MTEMEHRSMTQHKLCIQRTKQGCETSWMIHREGEAQDTDQKLLCERKGCASKLVWTSEAQEGTEQSVQCSYFTDYLCLMMNNKLFNIVVWHPVSTSEYTNEHLSFWRPAFQMSSRFSGEDEMKIIRLKTNNKDNHKRVKTEHWGESAWSAKHI